MNSSHFTEILLEWYSQNRRHLPWRDTKDPYKIWLSEILLQQTRVEQGLPYYLKFISRFPSVKDLAAASEEEVLKLWQGLGYYSRARNLRKAAIIINEEYNGLFPDNYKDLISLPGIGDYTASAIASICFNRPEAVVDGNVYRVLSRYFGVEIPIDSTAGKRYFKELATELIDPEQPGEYNQAVMEFGATCCTPKKPNCEACVLSNSCMALRDNMVQDLPVKSRGVKIRTRYFNYLVLRDPHMRTLMEQRKGNGIWQNLFQFPLVESAKTLNQDEIMDKLKDRLPDISPLTIYEPSAEYRIHKLSHQHLVTKFWVLPVAHELKGGLSIDEAEKLPMPVLVADTIKTLKNSYF